MSAVLGWSAAGAWVAAALLATPAAVWLRLRRGRPGPATLLLGVFLAAQLAGLGWVGERDVEALLERRAWAGVPAWLGWMLGASGLAALTAARHQEGVPDRAAALAFGLFGLGHALRELALVAASGRL